LPAARARPSFDATGRPGAAAAAGQPTTGSQWTRG